MKDRNSKFVLAISGGVDSMVLLNLFLQTNHNFCVCHVNHNIRSDSHKDESLIRSICERNNIPFFLKSIDVEQYCRDNKVSTELGAREIRYTFFQTIMDKYQYDYLVTAHNADDQIETMLFNLCRGSGVQGLAGMSAFDDKRKIIRPLLSMTKKEIYHYAKDNGIMWNEDSTNKENDYDRNFIRNEIIPMMEEMRSGVKQVLLRENDYFGKVAEFLSFSVDKWMAENYVNGTFKRQSFLEIPELLQGEVLKQLWNDLYGNGFTTKVLFEVKRWLTSGNGNTSVVFGKSHKLYLKSNIVTMKNID
jgi:tRNA(Ile)-lysidine synthase